MQKAKNILDLWRHRSLSLTGKVQVINTLVASLFVYKMTALPRIPSVYIESLNRLMEDFIWNGKKAKIPLKTLQMKREDGGMNLVNFKLKDESLKAAWVKTIHYDPSCGNIAFAFVNEDLDDLIWECNLRVQDIPKLSCLSVDNDFWIDVLKAWEHFNFEEDIRKDMDPIIWLNSHIRIGGLPFIWKEVFYKGLLCVSQLYEHGHILSADVCCERYGTSVMQYNSLISALPRCLKEYYSLNPRIDPCDSHVSAANLCKVRQSACATKTIYTSLIKAEKVSLCEKTERWIKDLETSLVEEEFIKLCDRIHHITCVGKLRSFQYRLLHRAIVTNIHLAKWGMMESDLCSFCGLDRETYLHVFIQCPNVCKMWNVGRGVLDKRGFVYDNDSRSRLLRNLSQKSAVNMVYVIIKQYIYSKRCRKQTLSDRELLHTINDFINIEKFYAVKDIKLSKFNAKWNITDKTVTQFNIDSINNVL